jgi:UDP-2,3-diacylglucosamine pyrophosphatase LpxH
MPKFKIVVSDFHLGAGPPTGGNPLEDFTVDAEFASFLDTIAAESERDGADVELILNGDTFEMLQVPHTDDFDPEEEYPPERYHSSLAEDSARKMALIVRGHPVFFEALCDFIQPGSPQRRVTFVKGNHDLDLHWTLVQDQIRQALEASDDRFSLLSFVERRIRREGIYVEHGNQYGERVDQVQDMEEPHDPDRPGQLDYPPGSWFVMNIFNEIERERYWVDGVKPITALIWFALKYDFLFAARAVATLLRALPRLRMRSWPWMSPRPKRWPDSWRTLTCAKRSPGATRRTRPFGPGSMPGWLQRSLLLPPIVARLPWPWRRRLMPWPWARRSSGGCGSPSFMLPASERWRKMCG